jgi:hypothetical protein
MARAAQQHLLQRSLGVLIGLVLACVATALAAGVDPDVICQRSCATLDGLNALIGADAVRWLMCACFAALALGFTLKGLRSPAPAAAQPTTGFTPTPAQRAMCEQHQSPVLPYANHDMVAMATQTLGEQPIHGMRTRNAQDRVTWFFHCGEFSGDKDSYKPVHIRHALLLLPEIERYLCLAPGFRFTLDAEGHEDVWREGEADRTA